MQNAEWNFCSENTTHFVEQLNQTTGLHISLLWKEELEDTVLPP